MKTEESANKSNKLSPDVKDTALQLAIQDFEKFCSYARVNSKQLKVCIDRDKGLSYQQIANKLRISRSYVKKISDRCIR